MPEGHTLHRLATDLTAAFAGRRVRVSSPQGRFAADAATLDGATVVGAESAGKHLFVEFDAERYVHVHLGLIGSFDVRSGPAPAPVGQVRLRIESRTGSELARRYGNEDGSMTAALAGEPRTWSPHGGIAFAR